MKIWLFAIVIPMQKKATVFLIGKLTVKDFMQGEFEVADPNTI